MTDRIHKYPRTRHLEGSRLQPGDHDLEQVAWTSLVGRRLVIEEKLDGANAGVRFTAGGELRLQSRGGEGDLARCLMVPGRAVVGLDTSAEAVAKAPLYLPSESQVVSNQSVKRQSTFVGSFLRLRNRPCR